MTLRALLAVVLLFTTLARKVIFVQEVFRHGARYPLFNDIEDGSQIIYKEHLLGELTAQGKHMHYLLGKALYAKYWSSLFQGTQFLEQYNPTQIYVRSTNVNRTIESAQSQMLGWLQNLKPTILPTTLFNFSLPPYELAREQANFSQPSWQVFGVDHATYFTVPIHTEDQIQQDTPSANPYYEGDFLLKYVPQNCPNQVFWSKQNLASAAAIRIKNSLQVEDALRKLSSTFGKEIKYEEAYHYIDNSIEMTYLGEKPLDIFTGTLQPIYNFIFITSTIFSFYGSTEQLQVTTTRLLEAILNNMRLAGDDNGPKLVLYSAHDTTVLQLLVALGFTSIDCITDRFLNNIDNADSCISEYPPFAANLIFQLWRQDSGSLTVSVVYNGRELKIPLCQSKSCSLKAVEQFVEKFVVQDPNEDCGVRDHYVKLYIVIGVLSVCLLVLIGLEMRRRLKDKLQKVLEAAEEKKNYMTNFEERDADIEGEKNSDK